MPAAALLLAGTVLNGAAAAGADDVALETRLVASGVPGRIVFELSNVSGRDLSVLRTDTPLAATLTADAFDIRAAQPARAGADRARYLGRRYKRVAPSREDFVEIAAGDSLRAVIDLARYYDVPATGDYRVDYRGSIDHRPASGRRSVESGLLGTDFHVPGPIVSLEPSRFAYRTRPPLFNGCSAEQQTILVEAGTAAEGITNSALSSLEGLAAERRATSPRYRRWFGEYDAARYDLVTANYAVIAEALTGATLTYDCTCTESAFAYVFPNSPYDIYVCPAFFRASLLGTDSRAGTLVHELSHFNLLAATSDFRYGQTSVAALAEDDPERAVGNADSYEYFAENTPALPMSDDPPRGAPIEGEPTALPLDTVRGGSLSIGQIAWFTVTAAETIRLDSLVGDADLYVYTSPSPGEGSLACASENDAGTPDVCSTGGDGTHHVAVKAYADTRFELRARGRDGSLSKPPGGSMPNAPVDDDPRTASGSGGGPGGGSGGLGWAWLLVGGVTMVRRARGPRDR